MITDFPDKPCLCGSTDWWYRMPEPGPGEWLCGRCHPAPHPIITLKFRVIKGNYKLYKVWQQIITLEGEEKAEALKKLHPALDKLKGLNRQLKEAGATDCLYIENGKKLRKCLGQEEKFFCHVCPNDYWFDKELMSLGRKNEFGR